MQDVPRALRDHPRLVSIVCALVLCAGFALQLFEFGDELLPVAAMYFSAAALGLDAAANGVRKRAGFGPSIANLAPGGWTIFGAMFWIVAVPAYYLGARRRKNREDGLPREPMTWGSWVAIGAFALLGVILACAPLVH
ncbi:MAG: hypothetical protein K1X94_34940 [Sandaracinaceae bacterium]|nr:hypothetical protein [Sandaracinaceae bacterium]